MWRISLFVCFRFYGLCWPIMKILSCRPDILKVNNKSIMSSPRFCVSVSVCMSVSLDVSICKKLQLLEKIQLMVSFINLRLHYLLINRRFLNFKSSTETRYKSELLRIKNGIIRYEQLELKCTVKIYLKVRPIFFMRE